MGQLGTRQEQLEAEIAAGTAPSPARLHPRVAETYHERVATLVTALEEAEHQGEAKDAIRGLIDEIVVTPVEGSGKRPVPRIDLQGSLAGILSLARVSRPSLERKKPPVMGGFGCGRISGCGSRI